MPLDYTDIDLAEVLRDACVISRAIGIGYDVKADAGFVGRIATLSDALSHAYRLKSRGELVFIVNDDGTTDHVMLSRTHSTVTARVLHTFPASQES